MLMTLYVYQNQVLLYVRTYVHTYVPMYVYVCMSLSLFVYYTYVCVCLYIVRMYVCKNPKAGRARVTAVFGISLMLVHRGNMDTLQYMTVYTYV